MFIFVHIIQMKQEKNMKLTFKIKEDIGSVCVRILTVQDPQQITHNFLKGMRIEHTQ